MFRNRHGRHFYTHKGEFDMKVSMVLKVGTIAAAGILMAACSSYSDKNASKTGNQSAMNNGAQSYGAGNSSGYQTTASGSNNGLYVNSLSAPSSQTYYFGFDSNKVNVSDVKAIDAQAAYLASHPNAKIRLEGNTDNRGSREYNVGLGWRRDQAIERYFTERGVSPKQIQMVSYGKEHPAVVGNTPRDWSLNRRVNLIYKAKS
jgi:peptidoglycan-associated lipoprotein